MGLEQAWVRPERPGASFNISKWRCDRYSYRLIALVAHDHKKKDLIEWAKYNRGTLASHELYATGTTGACFERELDIPLTKLKSGPLGGDQQIGAKISEGEIDFLVFFWDPMGQQPMIRM